MLLKRIQILSSDDDSDVELSDPTNKRIKLLKQQDSVSITSVVTLFYKRQIVHSKPQTINKKERSSCCIYCKEVYVAWQTESTSKGNPKFSKSYILQHLKSCTHNNGKAAYKKHIDFTTAGSNNISILFPTNANNEYFYQSSCEFCGELVCVSVKKPTKGTEAKLWSAHLSERCTFIPIARANFFNTNQFEQKLDKRFTDSKVYKHANSTGVKKSCFYVFRSHIALIHDNDSFLGSITYVGSTANKDSDPFSKRMKHHIQMQKFDKRTTDAIPIAYATEDDVRKIEAVAYWLFKGRDGFRNTASIVDPIVGMSAVEFNTIASSLSVLLGRFYIDYSSKINVEQQKVKIKEAYLTVFSKAREDCSKLLVDEREKQTFKSNDGVLLSPSMMNAIGSDPELMRKFEAVLSEAQSKINMK